MRLFSLLTAFALPALLVAAPVPKDKEKQKDEDAIQGTWKIDKFDLGGGPGAPPQAELDKIQFVFGKDGMLKVAGGPGGEEMTGSHKLDPAAKVKTIDMTVNPPKGVNDGKPETMLGLYELEGDTLKLCITNGPNKNRPEEIKPDGKAGVAVITFSRVKEDKKEEKKDEKKDK
jgi:uncharacterized protein (TIGR03067 family)